MMIQPPPATGSSTSSASSVSYHNSHGSDFDFKMVHSRTVSVLCAPISYMEGSRAAAVIQLVNKSLPMKIGADDANANPTGIAHFSNDDEEVGIVCAIACDLQYSHVAQPSTHPPTPSRAQLLCELAEHLSASLRVKYGNGSLAVQDDLHSARMEFSQTYNRVARKLSVANRGDQYGGRKSQNLQMDRRTIKRLVTRKSSMVMLQSISRSSRDLTDLDDIAAAAVVAADKGWVNGGGVARETSHGDLTL